MGGGVLLVVGGVRLVVVRVQQGYDAQGFFLVPLGYDGRDSFSTPQVRELPQLQLVLRALHDVRVRVHGVQVLHDVRVLHGGLLVLRGGLVQHGVLAEHNVLGLGYSEVLGLGYSEVLVNGV